MIQNTFLDKSIVESYSGSEPVTLAEAKTQCRVDFTDDDTLISDLITAARQSIEEYCHISLVPKVVTLTVNMTEQLKSNYAQPFQVREAFGVFELPYGPASDGVVASATNSDNTITGLVANTDYFLTGAAFQTIRISNNWENVTLVYSAGPSEVWTIPRALVRAILNEIAYRYSQRGEPTNIRATAFTDEGVCQAARVLAKPYIRLNWI